MFAIADAIDVSPTEVRSPPLYKIMDVSGIENAFFRPGLDESDRLRTGIIEFRYTDYLVRVRSDGWIQIYERTETE